VQRWVNQAYNDRIAFTCLRINHGLEDAFEIATLEGQQLIKGYLTLGSAARQDHLLYNGQTLLLHEHMLGTA